jgi:hypothetical protein
VPWPKGKPRGPRKEMLARAEAIRAAKKENPLASSDAIVKKTRKATFTVSRPVQTDFTVLSPAKPGTGKRAKAALDEVRKKRKGWATKLVHPTYSIEPCPNCDFPEADGGYCPECGWTEWQRKGRR